jgi:hypothetical protein
MYASMDASADRLDVWEARYIGHVNAIKGAHPDGMRVRPPQRCALHDAAQRERWASQMHQSRTDRCEKLS